MDFLDKQIARPRSWEKFEELSRALFGAVWDDPLAEKNGRAGQAQNGVDVFLSPKHNNKAVYGIQCKGKDALYGAKATTKEFDDELAKAESFEPKLSKWIFATTAANDAKLQKHARKISKARLLEGKFPVHVLGWETIQALLDQNRSVVAQFYPEHVDATSDRIELLRTASLSALNSIEDTVVHGDTSLSLIRADIWSGAKSAMAGNAVLRLTGEGGSGKSAILRRLGLDFSGELLVLKDSLITAKSWQEFTANIGAPGTASTFVDRFSGSGSCLLLIDGADRLLLSERREVVTELLEQIAKSPFADNWKIVTSARNFQGQDIVSAALKEAGFNDLGNQVEIGALSKDDAASLGSAFPSFARMLAREDLASQNRTLFLLRELFQRESAPTGSFTEMDLAGAWATKQGASESSNRSKALSQLGSLLIKDPNRRPGRAEIDATGLQCLIDEGAVVVDARRDAIALSFDVHEDWLLARCLERERDNLADVLNDAGEPLWWMRAIRLTGQLLLEAGDHKAWVTLLELLDADQRLDPAWSRSLLVAALYSEKTKEILDDLQPAFLANDAHLLFRLLETLQVFESRINESLFNAPHLADMSETERYRLLAYLKRPQFPSWIAFLKWSLPYWEHWPASLVPKLSQIAELWSRATEQMPNRLSQDMAAICHRWLVEIEDARHPDHWDDRRAPFDHELPHHGDWEKVESRLREVIVLSIQSARPITKDYLERLAQMPRLRSAREELLESPYRVPSVLPKEWVDMCLQQFVPPRRRTRHGSDSIFPDQLFSWSEYHDAGIRGNSRFFPSSPVRAGFSQLFETDEVEALRLFHRLEMRAAVFWRWYSRIEDRKNPKPLVLEMPWGDVPLWGDETVYRWSSGILGSNVLGSAYLALDDWLHKQMADGRSPEELLKLVLQRHGLVTTASPCIAIFHEHINTPGAMDWCGPFLGEPRLWGYDIRRHIDDQGNAHRIGYMGAGEIHVEAIEKFHKRRATQQPISHSFLLPFRFKASEKAQRAFDERRNKWEPDDLVEFIAELDDPAAMAQHQERIKRCFSDSDPRQIELQESGEDNQIVVTINPPEEALPEIAKLNEDQRRISEANRLFNWVNMSRQDGAVNQAMTLDEGITLAAKLMSEAQSAADSQFGSLGIIKNAAIVGAAAVLAHFGDDENILMHRSWTEEVLLGGARIRRSAEDLQFLFDQSILSFDPQEFAAWGLPALASREPYSKEIDTVVLALVVQRLHAISAAVMEGLRWDRRKDFAWSVAIAALDCCVLDIGHYWRGDTEKLKAAARMAKRRKRAIERGLKNKNLSRMPDIPPNPYKMEWIWTKDWKRPIRHLKMRSKTGLDWTKAKEILERVNWSEVAATDSRKALFSSYLKSLVEWTQRYSEEDSKRHDSRYPYEWGHALAKSIGQYSAATGEGNDWESLLSFTYHDRAEDLISDFLDAISQELMISQREPDERFWSAWMPAADWVMQNSVPKRRTNWGRIPHAVQSAGFVGPYMTPVPPDWPYLASLLPRIDDWQQATKHLPSAAVSLLAIVERMNVDQRKQWYLLWLQRLVDQNGSDESFWSYGGLGDKSAALVKTLSKEQDVDASSVRRNLAAIADAGSVVARELIPRFAKGRPN